MKFSCMNILISDITVIFYRYSVTGGNNTEVDMVDSTQMEKFEFDKSNQTYLGKHYYQQLAKTSQTKHILVNITSNN